MPQTGSGYVLFVGGGGRPSGVCVCVFWGMMVLEAVGPFFSAQTQTKHEGVAVGKHNNMRRASLTPRDSRHTLYTR